MARLHSSLGDRTVYTAAGMAKAQGYAATVYEDPAGTVLANLAVYDPTNAAVPGAAIPGAALTVDPWSNRPAFWDLNDRNVLYISVAGPTGIPGPLEPIRPDAQPQVTALATRVDTVEDTAAAAETPAGAQAKADAAQAAAEAIAATGLAAHTADTTGAHGIADTGALVVTMDPRLSDQRTPLDDSVTDAKVAAGANIAQSKVSGLVTALAGKVAKGELVVNVKDYGAKGDGSTNDTAAINAALVAITPGTTLLFPPGRYMTDGNHVVNQPSVIIKGSSGRAQTYNSQAQLYLRNGANVDMLIIAANQVTVRDLSLYGNKTNQTVTSRGLVTPPTSAASYLLLDAVWVDSFNGDGFSFESSGGTLSSTINNCESRVNNGYGMRFYGTSTDSMVSNCYIDQNVQSGVFCSSGDLSLTSCHIWGNGTGNTGDLDGITFQSSAGCRVINCYIETQLNGAGIRFKSGANRGHIVSGCDIWSNGNQGIFAFSASNCVISANVVRTNNYKSGSGANGAGIAVDSCNGLVITANQFYSIGASRQTYGYYEIGSSNVDIWFTGNMSRATDHTTGGVFLGPGTANGPVDAAIQTGRVTPTYGASITPNANGGNWQTITVTNVTAFTVNAPTKPPDSSHTQELTIEVVNGSGGAMGAITWNAAFVLVGGVFTNPANGKKRWIRFAWNGSSWVEISRAGADY